jgi:ribulose 1,5-bisphosphate synthetase/thiazole synthase
MSHISEAARRTQVIADVDVLVCGGGSAGVAAAVSAARNGASVLLLERYGYLGGLATGGLVITVPPLDNGINSEIRRTLERADVYREGENLGDDPSVDGLIAVDPELLKHEFAMMVLGAGANLLFHTYIVEAIAEDGTVKGVIVENKAGRSAILAKVVIDVTGDADVAASAGATFVMEEQPLPVTLMANLGGVDGRRAIATLGNWGNLRRVVSEAVACGELEFDLDVHSKYFAPGVFAAELCHPGELNLWPGSMLGVNGLDPEQLTRAEIVTRDHALRLAAFLKRRVPGFEGSWLEYTADQIGVRETRRVVGTSSPTLNEALSGTCADAVAKPYSRRRMRIPYGSLVPEAIDGLLVAGRAMSAQQEAMVQLRLIPVCLATGQAAGTAAALAAGTGTTPRKIDVACLQQTLVEQGVDLAIEEPTAASERL